MIVLGENDVGVDALLDRFDGAAEIAAFEAGGDNPHGLEVLALDFGVSGFDGNIGQVGDRFELHVREEDLQAADVRYAEGPAAGIDHSDIGELFPFRNGADYVSFEGILELEL